MKGIVSALMAVTLFLCTCPAALAHEARTVPAKPRILLLTSMALPPLERIPQAYRAYFKTAKFRIEARFREFFDEQLGAELRSGSVELAVLHDANAYDTWKAIKSPGNVAVFWFSHAGVGPLGGAILQDVHGNNVLPVFQAIHSDTRVLAITGCDSKAVSRSMNDQGFFPDASLQIVGSDPKIEATYGFEQTLRESVAGIRKAIAAYAPHSADELREQACQAKTGYAIAIRRELDPTIARPDQGIQTSPVIVTLGGKLVTVFPPGGPGDGQRQTLAAVLPAPADGAPLRASQLKIAVDGGTQAAEDRRWLGDFEIEGSWADARWQLFTKPGTTMPMGTSTHVYHYKGPLDFARAQAPEQLVPSDCRAADLPAVSGIAHRMPQVFGAAGDGSLGAGTAVGGGLSAPGGGQPLWARISIGGRDGRFHQLATVYGRLNAEGILNPLAQDNRVPYLNLDFAALTFGRTERNGEHAGIELGKAVVTRDMPLDESRVIRVDLFAVDLEAHTPKDEGADPKRASFMNLTADLLGFKTVERIRATGGDFNGLHLASIRTEKGVDLRLSERFQTRFLLGMESDVSVGFKQGWAPAVYSKLKFYSQVRADLQNLVGSDLRLSAFAEASAPVTLETGEDTEAELRLIAGLLIAH